MDNRMNGQKLQEFLAKTSGEHAVSPDGMIRFLEDVLINAKLWMTFLDPNGKVLIWNVAAEEITGYTNGEVLGRNEVWKWLYPDPQYRAKVTDTIIDGIRNQQYLENFETLVRTKSGDTRRISWNTRQLSNPEGTRIGYILLGNDITEIARVRAALKEREERYRNVINTQTEFICRFRPDGTHIFVNDAYCRYFGLKCDEILEHHFRPGIPKEDREKVRQFFARLTPENPDGTIEHRIIMPGGEPRWQQWNERAIFDPDGTLLEYQSVGRDITDRKRAELAVQKSEAMYRSLVESTGDSIYLVDRECHYLYMNTNHLQRLGLDPAQYIGTPYSDTHDLDDTKVFCAIVKRVFTTGESDEDEYEQKGRWFLRHFSPVIESSSNQILAVTIVSSEITDLKKAEAEIREREERYRNVVNTQTEFICRFRPDGTHIFVNDAYCKYFGLKCDVILGHQFRPDIPREDREKVRQFFASLTPETPTGTIEHRILMPGGELRWQQWNEQAIFDPDGTLIEYQSVGRDITALKKAEAALKESNERAIQFIKEAAMRLKTPVEVVEDNIQLLMEDLEAGDVDPQQLLLRLSIQVKRMEQIQVNLRDLNRAIVDQFGELSPASKRFLTQ